MGDDGGQIVELRLPSERGTGAVARGDDLCGIACATARELDLEIDAVHDLTTAVPFAQTLRFEDGQDIIDFLFRR